MSAPRSQQAAPDEGAASPRLPMLTVIDRLLAIARDARVDAGVAHADGDHERREYLYGEHRGLMESTEVMLAFDWTAAWREACTIRTVDQLDALPTGSVVRDADQQIAIADEALGRRFWSLPAGGAVTALDFPLPALVLWHPDWDAS